MSWPLACALAVLVLAGCSSTPVPPAAGAAPAPGSTALPSRPQLSAAEAARHTLAEHLAQGAQPWQPRTPEPADWHRPDAVVAPDAGGSQHPLQAAIDAAPAAGAGSGRRHVIQLRPGSYRGPVCIRGKAPLLLVGDPADAALVRIVDSRHNAQPKRAGVDAAQPCHPDLAAASIGTPGSATLVVASDDVQLAHLTVENDAMAAVRHGAVYPPGVGESGGAQAVALLVQADRVLLHQVRLLGHQDTLFVRHPPAAGPAALQGARVLVQHSTVAGDVDFIFGNGTLVIDDSSIVSRAGRRTPGSGGHVLAPSTRPGQRLGFLVQHSRFVAEPGLAPGQVSLGRAWDEGVARGTWQPADAAQPSPNGQALVRDSTLGPHIGPVDAPWSASTSRRPFAAEGPQANRFAEFNNRPGPALAPPGPADLARALAWARQPLAPGDGWASAEAGTRGGADALPADVHTAHDRASLVAALRPHAPGQERPRIVLLHGRIDLSTDDAGRPLGADDFRDPAFSWDAFARAYDPATWGRRNPEGPLEDARRRSARRQSAQVVLRVPPRSTLVGVGAGAHLVHGGLLLDKVEDVVLRNLHLSDAYDHFPAWEPSDNGRGEWNSDYDNLALRGARRVWIDHCSFDDGQRPDSDEPLLLGRPLQRHDGLLDITAGSDLVTVSWNHFHAHGKTSLVGSSDRATGDAGRLRVTFHHNLWQDVAERAPRVRFGQVHLFNNLHLARDGADPALAYAIGIGHQAQIVSQANAFVTPVDFPMARLLRRLGVGAFSDQGSLHNGQPLVVADLPAPDWQPLPRLPPHAAADVPPLVLRGAGAGRLPLPPPPLR